MPRGDGTGPNGAGSKTGKQRGYCSGYKSPGFENTNDVPRRGNYRTNTQGTKGVFSRLRSQNTKKK